MTVFISYARANQDAADQLRADVERCHRDAWVDQELTGGQSWWRAILDHVRRCDVFVVALSPEWVRSTACDLELNYAVALGRPVLPVMVAKVDPRLAPPAVADAQILSYLHRNPEATFALRDALDTMPTAPPLPSPLPPEPPAPISYLHNVILMLNTPELKPHDQDTLWQQLRAVLDVTAADDRPELLDLARRFRLRPDLLPRLAGEIDAVLEPPTSPGSKTTARTQPTKSHVAPNRRRLLRVAIPVAAVVAAAVVWIAIPDGDGQGPGPATPSTENGSTAKPTFTMESLWKFPGAKAETELRSLGWVGRLSRKEVTVTDRTLDGLVITQDPRPGAKVATDVPVTVTVGVFDAG